MNVALPERKLRTMHLFAGAGGGILADLLLGHEPVCAVEIEDYPRRVLLARQRDGILPRFPIWDDVCTFDGKPWRGSVDIVAGGFPCQDISIAGKGDGLDGERSGLWREMARVIGEVRPRFAFVENSPMLTLRGLGVVLGDLSEMGFDARWGVLGACHAGAPHERERIWIVAYSCESGFMDREGFERRPQSGSVFREFDGATRDPVRLEALGCVRRKADGLGDELDRLAALGNGQVPAVAALAWQILGGNVKESKDVSQGVRG